MSELLRWGAATDAGRVRDGNEDAFLAEPLVFAVADGMGGHQAGEVASAMAVDVLRQRLSEGAPSVDVVVAAVVEANAAIFQTARRNTAQMGMGTTITMLAVLPADEPTPTGGAGEAQPTPAQPDGVEPTGAGPIDDTGTAPGGATPDGVEPVLSEPAPGATPRLAIANVGDSRTYLLRAGELTRITVDHSYVQELLATGHLSEDEARNHPRRNIVTRALGIEPSVRVDSWALALVRGDRFVLCSDGLVDEIDDDAIGAIVRSTPDPQAAAEQLVAAALDHGGRDNVTVVVVDVVLGADPAPSDDAPAEHSSTMLMPVVGTAGVAADPLAADAAPRGRRRQLSTRTFLVLLAVAALLTVIVTLVAVVLDGGDAPAPTTTTPTTTPVTTVAPTTTSPTSSTEPGAVTTTAPEPTASVTPTTVGGP